jgi:hypothetical protein
MNEYWFILNDPMSTTALLRRRNVYLLGFLGVIPSWVWLLQFSQ